MYIYCTCIICTYLYVYVCVQMHITWHIIWFPHRKLPQLRRSTPAMHSQRSQSHPLAVLLAETNRIVHQGRIGLRQKWVKPWFHHRKIQGLTMFNIFQHGWNMVRTKRNLSEYLGFVIWDDHPPPTPGNLKWWVSTEYAMKFVIMWFSHGSEHRLTV